MKNTFLTIFSLCSFTLAAIAQGTVQHTAKGVQCQIVTPNTGEKIKQNDVITFQAIQKTDKDSILFSSFLQGQPVKVQVHPSTSVGDLMDVFPLLALNDSAIVKVPVDSIFKGHEESRPPFLVKGSNLTFIIKILKIQSLNEAIAERNAG
ncbi:MAG: peptidylprolyl isomerase, partial [Mucilaginibacter sp.]|nr:peptidylprolyl isomerase [Mucilaginibacter sp.]